MKDTDPHLTTERALLRDAYFGAILPDDKTDSVRGAWRELWSRVSKEYTEEQLAMLGEAMVFADWAHEGKKRDSGEPYIIHPINVASILADMQLDVSTLVAALLHDVIEDTKFGKDEILVRFGQNVTTLVDGVTKLNKLPFMSAEDYQAENLRKMFVVMGEDIRVVLIKLADRLHNMRTLDALRPDKQQRIAKETLEIYAPLAHRLGIYEIKRGLEDLSFKYSDRETYEEIRKKVRKRLPDREAVVQKGINILHQHLEKAKIDARIKGRAKHFYSIYEKMQRKKLPIEQIYDLLAIRVLVKDIPTCYAVLGIVHATWVPIPGQFDDYIANPKSNMYQSLHTTVVGPSGEPLEIQIRTDEMNSLAEYGVAAHWRYKHVGSFSKLMEQKLDWIRKALEGENEGDDPSAFVEDLKSDVFTSEICVFTPKGRPILMPKGSTMLDFAYAVHTEVGHHCVGATVNGRIVPLSTEINKGEIVKITTSPQSSPSRDWLKIVHSNKTRNKIKAWFKQTEKVDRQDKLLRGQEALDRELKRRELPVSNSDEMLPHINKVAKDMGMNNGEDLIVAIGSSNAGPSTVAQRLAQIWLQVKVNEGTALTITPKLTGKKQDCDILVAGATGVQTTLSNCCNPVPGDLIVGYATHMRGITIHRADCPSISNVPMDRITPASWGAHSGKMYVGRLKIEAFDRNDLLRDITEVISQSGGGILSIKGTAVGNTLYHTRIELRVRDLNHLLEISGKINNLKDMLEVSRG